MITTLFTAAKTIKRVTGEKSSSGGATGAICRGTLRFFQFIMGLVVVGLYGIDVHASHHAGVAIDARWLYAVVVGSLAALIACFYALPFVKSYKLFYCDAVILLTWIVTLGIFGKLFLGADVAQDHRVTRMKHAVYVDAVNLLLWSITLSLSVFTWMKKRRDSPSVGDAKV